MSEKGADIQPESEVVQPARVFAPKKCKAEGCENIFTPTVGYQTYCPEHREARERTKRSRKRAMERKAREEEHANSMTRDEFWQQNRKQLTKAQREQLEQRTDDILLLAAAMDDYVSGTDQTSQQDSRVAGNHQRAREILRLR